MYAERTWFALAIYRFYQLAMALHDAENANERSVEEFNTAWHDVLVFTGHVILKDRDEGRSYDAEDSAAFEQILEAEQLSPEKRAQARNMRDNVMLVARSALAESDLRRGDDTPDSDPGGGLCSPDSDDGPR